MGDKVERTEPLPAHPAPAEPVPTEEVVRTGNTIVGTFTEGSVVAGRFRVVRLVGRGGMGEVYEALDSALSTRVALKTLRVESVGSDERLARLKREVVLARQVSHPNVCRMFHFEEGSAEAEPVAFLTMEFLDGETLQARLKRLGPMDRVEALPLLEQMADGLEAIHAQGIVHRDFKPGNVMLVPSGSGLRAVVTDFGIAHREGLGETLTGGSVVVGTPAYMAPEVRSGEDATVRSDVYAFGVVACEVVTGHLPVEGVPGSVTSHWRRVLARALAGDPAERWDSPRAVVEALERPTRVSRRALLSALPIAALLAFLVASPGPRGWIERRIRKPAPLGSVTPENEAIAEAYARGRTLNQQLRWVEAVPVLEDVVRQQPNLVPAYVDLADALSASGYWQRSRDIGQEAMRRATLLSPGIRLAAEARYWNSIGDLEKARGVARQLYELEPQSVDAVLLYLRLLDPPSALQFASQARARGSVAIHDARLDLLEANAAAREAGGTDSCCTTGHSLAGLPGRARTLEALARAEEKTQGIDARFLQVRAKAIRAHLALIQGDYGEAVLLYGQTENFYQAEGYPFDEANSISRKAFALLQSGARENATPEAFRSLGILKGLGASPELVLYSSAFAVIFAINDRIALARKAIQFAEEAPENLRNREPAFLLVGAVIAAQIGDLPRASAMVDAVLLSEQPSYILSAVELKASLYLEQDRLDELDQHLEEWVGRGHERLGPSELALISLLRANARISAHKPQEAAALLRAISPAERQRRLSSILVAESKIARLEGRPTAAIRLATQALREAAHNYKSDSARVAQLQLARSYKAAGELTQATALLDKIRADAEREGLKGLELDVRLITWEALPPEPSRRQQELKQLEADATRAGFLLIARQAREAAAR